MIPLTNKKMKPIKRKNIFDIFCGWECTLYRVSICVALYELITTLLLPLTIRGRIGGQYGEVMYEVEGKYHLLMSLTNMSSECEANLIAALSFVHLIGLICVIMKWAHFYILVMLIRVGETAVVFYWWRNIYNESVKSHTMSQFALECYWHYSLATSIIYHFTLLCFTCDEIHKYQKRFIHYS